MRLTLQFHLLQTVHETFRHRCGVDDAICCYRLDELSCIYRLDLNDLDHIRDLVTVLIVSYYKPYAQRTKLFSEGRFDLQSCSNDLDIDATYLSFREVVLSWKEDAHRTSITRRTLWYIVNSTLIVCLSASVRPLLCIQV